MKKTFIVVISLAIFASVAQAQTETPDYDNQANNIVKFSFLQPLFGSTQFAYERAISPKMAWEVEAGVIGFAFGRGVYYDDVVKKRPLGCSLSFGVKFRTSRNSYHLLAGAYLKPELAISYFRRYYTYTGHFYNHSGGYVSKEDITSMALMLTFGKEVVFRNHFSIDWFVSLGYGFRSDDEFGFNYNFVGGAADFPLAFSTGFKIGYAFGKFKK